MIAILRNLSRRGVFAAAAAALCLASAAVFAQGAWPARAVHIIVPFPPGGPTDITARVYAEKLSARLNQPVVVENKPGPNGIAAYNAVLAAPADGYALVFATTGGQVLQPAINAYLKKPVEPDVNRLLVPVGLLADSPLVVVVSPSIPVNTMGELVEWLKANPTRANYASDGIGSTTHLAAEMYNDAVGVKAVHIPFKGTVDSMNALMQGSAHYAFSGILTPLALHRAGKLKIIAVAGASPVASLPGVPVLAEAARLPGFDVSSWFSLYAHKDVPADRIALLNTELQAIARLPDVIERFQTLGLQARSGPSAELGQQVQRDLRKWQDLLVRTQVKLN